MRSRKAAIAGAAAVVAAAAGADPRPFDAQALWSMRRISSPAVSADGALIAFVVRDTDFEANRGSTDIWLVDRGGGGVRQLTRDPASDVSPVWAPDGSLLFLSTRSGSSQVWRIDPRGGEAEPVTELGDGVSNLTVSPRGDRIAFTMEVFADCDTLSCTAERLTQRDDEQASGRVYDELFVRHWDAWEDGRRSHLFTMALPDGEPIDVTVGVRGDVPSKPFGGAEEITFTPDGEGLVFTMREGGTAEAWSTDFDLWLAPADGSGRPVALTPENEAWDTQPRFSPDGSLLAYLAMERPGYESDRLRLLVREWPDGEPRPLTRDWDRSISEFVFSEDGRTVFLTAGDTGEVKLFALDTATGSISELVGGGHVRSPAVAGDRLIFGRDDLAQPVELYSAALDGSDTRALTAFNAEALRQLRFGAFEQFSFAGWNGETVWGYMVEPVDRVAGERYPLAFIIHGGPQGSSGNEFHYRWNPQVYAGAGYAVVMIDFHGSTGYGQGFTDSIRGDWGGKPLEDLRKGLAAALERWSWIDGGRACALGASYGGYMINWIAGNWPDAFACLVNHDGVFDNRGMYFGTEELWFPEWDHVGSYFDNPEGHERHNPVLHVDRWRTPMLVVQGELDYRVPVSQGLGTFTALQRRGIPSRLLYFPDENHWVLSPANGLLWHRVVLEWLDRWTAPGGGEG
jgi:dipeptidyl aminopeptidase/acylaminoacyl peptidase